MSETPPTEQQTFDWQMDGGNDKSWGGKARSWIHDTPVRTRSLSACKTLAVWIPPQAQESLALNLRGREEGARPELDTLASLRAAEGGPSRSYVLVPSSAASEASTPASPAPDGHTPSSASPTPGDGTCSAHGSPECRCTTTYETLHEVAATLGSPRGHDEQATYAVVTTTDTTASGSSSLMRVASDRAAAPSPKDSRSTPSTQTMNSMIPPFTEDPPKPAPPVKSTFSAAASPARTSQWPDNDADSPERVPASSTSSPASPGLFDLDGYSSRTYPDCSLRTAVGTSESCLERWPTSGTAWAGGFSTAVSSECRSDGGGCSSSEPSLSMILEPPLSVPARYSLSARAARGILRRAEKRGRTLPSHLQAALEAVATT